MKTKVIHVRDAPRGWRFNREYVFIGRPSKWGNPFKVSEHGREKCLYMYEEKILGTRLHAEIGTELVGKTLVCFCKPEPCHGDVLALLAHQSTRPIDDDNDWKYDEPDIG